MLMKMPLDLNALRRIPLPCYPKPRLKKGQKEDRNRSRNSYGKARSETAAHLIPCFQADGMP